MKVYLIRHGTTEENKARVLIGQSNPSLAEEARNAMNPVESFNPDVIYSSPLKRAYETASLLFPDREITEDPDIMERGFGDFEGKPIVVLGVDEDGKNIYAFKDEKVLVENGGEPVGELEARIRRFIDRLREVDAGSVAVVSHGTLISNMVKVVFGEEKPRTSPRNIHMVCFTIENGKATDLRYNIGFDEA